MLKKKYCIDNVEPDLASASVDRCESVNGNPTLPDDPLEPHALVRDQDQLQLFYPQTDLLMFLLFYIHGNMDGMAAACSSRKELDVSPFYNFDYGWINNDCDWWNGENCVSVKRVSTPTGWNNISMKYSTNRVLMLLC